MKYAELSERRKANLRDARRYHEVEGISWWRDVYDDFIRIARIIGVNILCDPKGPNIFFSGFSNQGDGASFGAICSFCVDAIEKIRQETNDEALISIAETLTMAFLTNRIHGVQLAYVRVVAAGFARMKFTYIYTRDIAEDEERADTESFEEALKALADWLYRSLEAEYNYLTSDEFLDQMLEDLDVDYELECS